MFIYSRFTHLTPNTINEYTPKSIYSCLQPLQNKRSNDLCAVYPLWTLMINCISYRPLHVCYHSRAYTQAENKIRAKWIPQVLCNAYKVWMVNGVKKTHTKEPIRIRCYRSHRFNNLLSNIVLVRLAHYSTAFTSGHPHAWMFFFATTQWNRIWQIKFISFHSSFLFFFDQE